MDVLDNNNEPEKSRCELSMDVDDDRVIGVVNLKPTMLGNRRKQSKPIRVEHRTVGLLSHPAEIVQEHRTVSSHGKYDCTLCTLAYDDYEDLAWHQYETHGLISKMDQNEIREDEEHYEGREAGEVIRRSGIFHMDAYCDKCDREFCNKYFLKTHLASKHGIHDEEESPPTGLADNTPSPVNMTRTFSDDNHEERRSPATRSLSPVTSRSLSPTPASPRVSTGPTPITPTMSIPNINPHYHKLPDYPELNDFTKPRTSEEKKRSIEDFCELCQKHFCNKYYLRKHKMDVHGIHSDPYSVRRRLGLIGTNERNETTPSFASPTLLPQHNAHMMLMNPFGPMMALPPDPMLFPRYPVPGVMGLNLAPGKTLDYERSEEKPGSEEKRDDKPTLSHTHFIDELISKYDRNVDRRERHHGSSDESRSEEDATSPPKVSPKTEPSLDRNHESEKLERKPDHPRTCEVCLKVFADKYSLRMHKMNIHDIPKNKDNEKPPALPKTEAPPMLPSFITSSLSDPRFLPLPLPSSLAPFSTTNTMTSSPDIDVMASMYGSMAAAKLADRVTCDICNKEVCNKYFLKTHKVKMHGIDPATLLDTPKESSPEKEGVHLPNIIPGMSGVPNISGIPFVPTQELAEAEAVRREELLKLGIDPESYCEICRKEFCSKYFLRTHKLNMHGIPTDKPGNRKEDREISRREIMERERLIQLGHIPMAFSPLFGMGTEGRDKPMYPFLPSSPFRPNVKSCDEESIDSNKSEKSAKSKDPANSIRVKCELCNKELCNKYFLRTHKMKKHGIVDDVLSEGQQRKLLEMQRQGLFPVVSYNGFPKREIDTKSESPQAMDTAVCQICQESFPSSDLLHVHMFMTHGKMEKGAICQVCGLVCKDQLGLQLHMVQDHDVTINITPESSPSYIKESMLLEGMESPRQEGSPAIVENPLMDSFLKRSVDRVNESLHRETNINQKLFSCPHCPFKTRAFYHLRAHQKCRHGNSDSVTPIRKFRCRLCRKRFPSRFVLRFHSRRCQKSSDYATDTKMAKNYSVNLENRHLLRDASNFIMQKFSIANSGESQFANAFVYLPVSEKVKEPITVSLHLTPTER